MRYALKWRARRDSNPRPIGSKELVYATAS